MLLSLIYTIYTVCHLFTLEVWCHLIIVTVKRLINTKQTSKSNYFLTNYMGFNLVWSELIYSGWIIYWHGKAQLCWSFRSLSLPSSLSANLHEFVLPWSLHCCLATSCYYPPFIQLRCILVVCFWKFWYLLVRLTIEGPIVTKLIKSSLSFIQLCSSSTP